MKPVAFALLAPLVAAPLLATLGTVPRPVPTRDQPLTLVITTLDSAKADAFIGNLRFAGVRAVYSDGSEAAAGSAKRVAAAIGAPTRCVLRMLNATPSDSQIKCSNRVPLASAQSC
jgi:hypothetical protein